MGPTSDHFGATLALELAPAALFNFAVAFAVASALDRAGLGAISAGAAVAAGLAAFLLAWNCLRRFGRAARGFAIAEFKAPPVESDSCDGELLLTDAVAPAPVRQQPSEGELLLDDILESIGPDSRVVRLFQPRGSPTAGELQTRIERHLRCGQASDLPPDATEALHEALAALRQSLR